METTDVESFIDGRTLAKTELDEYTNIKHVMYDITGAREKDWHRTVFGVRAER